MENFITHAGKKIFYRVYGTGRPVILVHGFGEDGTIWDKQVESLQQEFQLIVPDLPGSGRSEMINDMSMEGMAESIHTIIHEENIDSCPVIGHSMGGYISMALVEKYFNHVSAFGLFHSSAFADTEEKKQARQTGIKTIQEKGAFAFLQTATPKLFSPLTAENNPGLIEKQVAACTGFSDNALIAYYEAMMNRPDRTTILRETQVPVLFVMGKYDTAVPLEDGLKQSHMPQQSHIHVLQLSGHMGMLEETGKSTMILQQFCGA